MGLMQGWGSVALHGGEGFRAQYARILCLFSDRVWDRELERLVGGLHWWRQLAGFPRIRNPARARVWEQKVAAAADRYAVPVLGLADAVRLGVLRELGVSDRVVRPMEGRLKALHRTCR
jgi:hypothetical protein